MKCEKKMNEFISKKKEFTKKKYVDATDLAEANHRKKKSIKILKYACNHLLSRYFSVH